MRKSATLMLLGAVLATGAACEKQQDRPKFGALNRTFLLVDGEGTRYGTVEMDPVSGGKLFDAEGRLIGTVVTPAVTSTVTTTMPVPAGAAPTY